MPDATAGRKVGGTRSYSYHTRSHYDGKLHLDLGVAPPLRLFALVALGGALGAAARFMVSRSLVGPGGDSFPWATLAVNVTGSLLLGLVLPQLLIAEGGAGWRAFLAAGFLGAFTTFSTFSYEAVVLLRQRHTIRAAVYVAASLTLGVGAIAAGAALGNLFSNNAP